MQSCVDISVECIFFKIGMLIYNLFFLVVLIDGLEILVLFLHIRMLEF
jgi:hypothetical protein